MRRFRTGRRAVAQRLGIVLLTLALGLGLTVAVAGPAGAVDDPTASMTINKAASASEVTPGQPFSYTIQIQCTAGTVSGCVNAAVNDTMPAGITIVGNPTISGNVPGAGNATVTHNETSFTATFIDDITGPDPGLAAGVVITITVPVQLDPDYPPDRSGVALENTATITADNANEKSSTAEVTPNVPPVLNAVTTKDITQLGGLPEPGTPADATVTGQNTSNMPVDELVISDPVDPTATPNPFDYLALTSLGEVTMPAGAEAVQVRAYVGGAWVDGPLGPPAALPGGVDPADVKGLQFVFTSTAGSGIAVDATASVGLNLAQTQAVVDAPKPLVITNTADTTVTLDDESKTSPTADDTYKIPPADVEVAASKTFDPDIVKAGDTSTVTLGGTNKTADDLTSMTITEPTPGSDNPFADGGLTFTGIGNGDPPDGSGVVWPRGATSAAITYSCAGTPGTPQTTTEQNTLPAPPAGCDPVTGFSVMFTGDIAQGAEATVPFGVVTDADQTADSVTRSNEVGVTGAIGTITGSDTATDDIVSLADRLAVAVSKKIAPAQIPSLPGQVAVIQLNGTVKPFPDSTTDAHQIVVQDPDPIAGDQWFDAFQPNSVTATSVPADATLTVQYWNGNAWVDVPGMVDIAGPTIVNEKFPDDVTENAQGLRFVYTSTRPEPDGFPPGTTVAPNYTSSLRTGMAGSDATITDCAGSSAGNGDLEAAADPTACDDIDLVPIDPGNIDPIDKNWDKDLLNARSGQQAGVTIGFSTQGYTGLQKGVITDSADPDTTTLPQSVYDVFDLVRLDPITTAMDPHLTFDQITGVELYRWAAGSTDPAAGSWVDAANDPCPAACDGTFPGFALTAAEQASTVGFRFTYVESPTRVQRISKPTDPPVGTGIAVSYNNDRHIHPVFQLRDELRSNTDVPITGEQVYNIAGSPGEIRNTVRATGWFEPDADPVLTVTDADDIALTDIPVTAAATKSWTGGPLGLPESGTPPNLYPTSRVTISGKNTTAAKIDRLQITDPANGTNPFDTFNLVRFTTITDPAAIGATSLVVTLTGAGAPCAAPAGCTRSQALALTEAQLTTVTGLTLTYTGRINSAATASATFDARLRPTSRDTGGPTRTGTVTNDVGVEVADLDDYPGVTPKTADDDAPASIVVQPQGIGVEAAKSFDPTRVVEPGHGPVTVTVQGQPTGPSRTVAMTLEDASPTFFNAYDLAALSPVTLTAPINRVRVDAYVGGTWTIDPVTGAPVLAGGEWKLGSAVPGPTVTLPSGVTDPAQVQGLRWSFTRADGGNWENPSHPIQRVSFSVTRRDTLHTGGSVDTDLGTAAPGETVAGNTSNSTTAGVTSSDRDVNGNPLTDSDTAYATLTYQHGNNAVQVRKGPNGEVQPGQPFTYRLTMKNTGVVPITNPVITDRFPTDAQGPQVVFPDGTGTYTYAIAGGSGMPTDPAQVTVAESATGVTWTFPAGSTIPVGATYTISFPMQTRSGLTANTSFVNSFGITGDRDWDTCDGTLDSATRECRANATNKVISAGAVAVTKLVKAEGSATLGVTRDPLSTDTRSCAANAEGFYARPCVPIAEPGGAVTWRLHYQNTGNRPDDRIVAVDRLPAVGDTLATDPDLRRGSQWRPLLSGERPSVAHGTATLNVWYTTAASPCTLDIGVDGTRCPAGSWVQWPDGATLPVSPATVTGVKFELLMDPALAPAATLDVDLPMTAPAFSPTAGADTIAYNTVGMAGRWVNTNGNRGYTLTTEPPRVGVALATGPVQVEKLLAGDAADQYAPDSFTATLSCTSAGQNVPLTAAQRNLTLTPGEPITVDDLPYHAECTVSAEGDQGQTSWTSTKVVVQQELTDVPIRLTNTYEYASLAITKSVESDAEDQGGTAVTYGPFTVDVTCSFLGEPVYAEGYGEANPMTAELADGDTVRFDRLPAGAECTVTESDDKGAVSTTIVTTAGDGDPVTRDGTAAPIELAPQDGDAPANTAAITNAFGVGSLALTKVVTGDVADVYGAGPFTVHVSCVLDDASGSRAVWDDDVLLGGDEPLSRTIDQIALGAQCTVTEPDDGDGGASSTTISPDQPVTIGGGDGPVTVTVTNSFDPGTLLLTKQVTGDAADFAPASFPVQVTCSADGAVLPGFPQTVTVTPGKDTEVDTLVGASCSAVETGTGSATAVTYDPAAAAGTDGSGEVLVGPGDQDPIEIGIDNQYRAGGLQIVKDITGPGAAIGPGPFTFSVVCAFNGVDDAYSGTVTLTRRGDATTLTSQVIAPLPVGSVCTVTETGNGGADNTPPPVTVTIPDVGDDGDPVVVPVGFVNPYSAGTLQISKVLAGDGASTATNLTFTVAVTCQVQTADGTRAEVYTGDVKLKGGQTVPVTGADGDPALLPLGAHCWAEETDDGGAAGVAVDHDSYDNAVVVEQSDEVGQLTITVTNTFDAPPTTSTSPTVGPTSSTTPPTVGPTTPTTTTSPTVGPTSSTTQPPAAPLPNTGAPVTRMLLIAALLLVAGAGLVLLTRRRRGSH